MALLIRMERALCVMLLAAIVTLVFVAAIMRTAGVPIIWSVDVAQLLFAWLCMLAANQTFHYGQHASVDIIIRRLSPGSRDKLFTLFDALMIAVLVVLVWYGAQLFNANPQRTLGSTRIGYRWVTLAVPVGAGLMTLTLLHRIFTRYRRQPVEAGL